VFWGNLNWMSWSVNEIKINARLQQIVDEHTGPWGEEDSLG